MHSPPTVPKLTEVKCYSTTISWGGIGYNDRNSPDNEGIANESKLENRNIIIVEKWIHEMILFCQTLPSYVIISSHNQTMEIFEELINIERTHLQQSYGLSSNTCNDIYRFLYVYSTGFYDHISYFVSDSYQQILQNMTKLYIDLLPRTSVIKDTINIEYESNERMTFYEMQLKMVDYCMENEMEKYNVRNCFKCEQLTKEHKRILQNLMNTENKLQITKQASKVLTIKLQSLLNKKFIMGKCLAKKEELFKISEMELKLFRKKHFCMKTDDENGWELKKKMNEEIEELLPFQYKNNIDFHKKLKYLELKLNGNIIPSKNTWLLKMSTLEMKAKEIFKELNVVQHQVNEYSKIIKLEIVKKLDKELLFQPRLENSAMCEQKEIELKLYKDKEIAFKSYFFLLNEILYNIFCIFQKHMNAIERRL